MLRGFLCKITGLSRAQMIRLIAQYRLSRRIRDRRGTPVKPEQRQCARPTTEQILRLLSLAERHTLTEDGHTVQIFDVQRTDR